MQREEAMRSLVAAHGALLRGLARRMMRSEPDAEDLVQDTFERAFNGLDQMRDPERSRSWLVSILHNVFLDRCRRQRIRPDAVSERNLELLPVAAATADAADEPSWADLTRQDLDRALQGLDPTYREVFELREFARCSYQEIAQRLGVTLRTAGTRLHRARAKLRELLSSTGNKHEQAL
jgi:RNA polymerase sigma-70 factor, ECF subfamily